MFPALWIAAKTASVRCRSDMPPAALAYTLATGNLHRRFVAHIATLLDDAPMPLLVWAVGDIARSKRLDVDAIWWNVAKLAHALGVRRRGRFRVTDSGGR